MGCFAKTPANVTAVKTDRLCKGAGIANSYVCPTCVDGGVADRAPRSPRSSKVQLPLPWVRVSFIVVSGANSK